MRFSLCSAYNLRFLPVQYKAVNTYIQLSVILFFSLNCCCFAKFDFSVPPVCSAWPLLYSPPPPEKMYILLQCCIIWLMWRHCCQSATTPVSAQCCSSSGVLTATTSLTPLQSFTGCIYHNYKVAVIAFWALNGVSSPYLDQLVRIADLPGHYCLRSALSHQLQVPAYRLATIGRCLFPVAASILWNSLPPDIQSSASLTRFLPQTEDLLVPANHFRAFCL